LLAFGEKAFGHYFKLKTSMVNWNETIEKWKPIFQLCDIINILKGDTMGVLEHNVRLNIRSHV
jgi:hypothetical protein